MAKHRLVLKEQAAVYHVMNRLVRKEFWLDDRCREAFVALLRRQAAFTGIEVMTYCVMSNHFHLLVRVPPSALIAHRTGCGLVDDATLMARYRAFYGKRRPLGSYTAEELEARLRAGGAVAEAARTRVLARMGDLSVFMRELKYNFILWFNDTHKNEGTIWAAKFKSVLIEDVVEVRTKVAAYVDLNPVRAGMVNDPGEYRWSGYAAAMAGQRFEQDGVAGLFSRGEGVAEALKVYRRMLFSVGEVGRIKDDGAVSGKVDSGRAEEVRAAGGRVRLGESLLCRWRFMAESRVIGNKAFLESVLGQKTDGNGNAERVARKGRVRPKELPESVFHEICAVVRGVIQ